MTNDEKIWREWWARNHPFDWFAKEPYGPIPHSLRLHVHSLCRAAFMREERNQAAASQPYDVTAYLEPCPKCSQRMSSGIHKAGSCDSDKSADQPEDAA